ncbi:flagellar hook-basal body complex protein FliE [Salimicrobium halophilum]|uniref:Flagellar hook-basal body complex protein FliE n=1 Tax=Salimicrobium halophilum TaxID=86666 RepID=A0A1G8QB66_9BACI|nr:flagellar hook-basal body complex protein FliE [Salimicrobium halophilum]SDJ01967.1 flagellar hook-basal body complex protein FliE [Salimicrobium halophilum]
MVQSINGLPQASIRETYDTTPNEVHTQFADSLKNAIEGVNKAKVESNEMTQALARGDVDDLHNVMITSQKASVMMTTATEMQSKVISAYKEVMRMQV